MEAAVTRFVATIKSRPEVGLVENIHWTIVGPMLRDQFAALGFDRRITVAELKGFARSEVAVPATYFIFKYLSHVRKPLGMSWADLAHVMDLVARGDFYHRVCAHLASFPAMLPPLDEMVAIVGEADPIGRPKHPGWLLPVGPVPSVEEFLMSHEAFEPNSKYGVLKAFDHGLTFLVANHVYNGLGFDSAPLEVREALPEAMATRVRGLVLDMFLGLAQQIQAAHKNTNITPADIATAYYRLVPERSLTFAQVKEYVAPIAQGRALEPEARRALTALGEPHYPLDEFAFPGPTPYPGNIRTFNQLVTDLGTLSGDTIIERALERIATGVTKDGRWQVRLAAALLEQSKEHSETFYFSTFLKLFGVGSMHNFHYPNERLSIFALSDALVAFDSCGVFRHVCERVALTLRARIPFSFEDHVCHPLAKRLRKHVLRAPANLQGRTPRAREDAAVQLVRETGAVDLRLKPSHAKILGHVFATENCLFDHPALSKPEARDYFKALSPVVQQRVILRFKDLFSAIVDLYKRPTFKAAEQHALFHAKFREWLDLTPEAFKAMASFEYM